jgi:F-type H+-transporting ATPase subunit gamma
MTDYVSGKYDQVFLAYSRFISVIRSGPTVMQLLPLEAPSAETKRERASYQFEPAAEELLNTLLPQYVEVVMYRALVESLAAEQAARMIAMKGATDSADEMIMNLTREYNRVRQTSITTQILEVVSGAEALEHSH